MFNAEHTHYFVGQDSVEYRLNRWNTGVDLNESRDAKSWVAAKASMDALVYGELIAWDPHCAKAGLAS